MNSFALGRSAVCPSDTNAILSKRLLLGPSVSLCEAQTAAGSKAKEFIPSYSAHGNMASLFIPSHPARHRFTMEFIPSKTRKLILNAYLV